MSRRVVVVGGGQAGLTVVDSLLARGFEGHVTIVEAGNELPYQRPPLSKDVLAGKATPESTYLKPLEHYADAGIELRLQTHVRSIHPAEKQVVLASGETVPYEDDAALAMAMRRTSDRLRSSEITPASIRAHYDERFAWTRFQARWQEHLTALRSS